MIFKLLDIIILVFFLIVLSQIFNWCKDHKRDNMEASVPFREVIMCADVFPYDSLPTAQKNDLENAAFVYQVEQSFYTMKKEDSYFVRVKIKNKLLAELSQSDAFPVESILSDNPHMLYGKYKNHWQFYDSADLPITPTEKFDGHSIFKLSRKDDVDNVIIGPLPEKPYRMEIKIDEGTGRNPRHDLKTPCSK